MVWRDVIITQLSNSSYFNELTKEVSEMNQTMPLIEFSDRHFKYIFKEATVYYINEDFLDYY